MAQSKLMRINDLRIEWCCRLQRPAARALTQSDTVASAAGANVSSMRPSETPPLRPSAAAARNATEAVRPAGEG